VTRLLALCLVACSFRQPDAADHYNATLAACERYQFAEPSARTRNQDVACRNMKRICIDGPVYAPSPAYGNKIVEAE
jgi:hypothetical protein